MELTCSACGSALLPAHKFCGKCGAPAPVMRQRRPRKLTPVQKAANQVMAFLPVILIVLAVLCAVLGIMSVAAKHSVNVAAVARYGGEVQRNSERMPLTEIYEVKEYAGLALAGIIYAVCQFILAGFAGFLVFKAYTSRTGLKKMVKVFCLGGLGCNLVYALMFPILGTHKESLNSMTLKATVFPHFTVFLAIALFGFLYLAAKLSRSRRKRR